MQSPASLPVHTNVQAMRQNVYNRKPIHNLWRIYMKIRGLHWGYDGGGMACGPVSGSTIVEICVTDEGHNYFVSVSEMDNFQHTGVSPVPMFDILMHMMHYDVQFDSEHEKYTANVIEDYDYENGDEPDEMYGSRFAKVIHLARLAMQAYTESEDGRPDMQAAMEFIEPYVNRDISEMDLPELEEETDEDEEGE